MVRLSILYISISQTHRTVENENPVPTFSYLASELRKCHPNLAYLHVIEPRFATGSAARSARAHESNDFLREIWRGKVYISDGGYTRETAMEQADAHENVVVAFGRHYTANVSLMSY